jgi:subtilisin family serine protease
VKRRSRAGRHHTVSPQRKALGVFAGGRQRKRKNFTFERLEDRYCFSLSPADVQINGVSNDTPEGAAAIRDLELQWFAMQTADAIATQARYIPNSLPNDPLFPFQWHLLNVGQEVGNPDFQHVFGVAGEDIDVVPVWNKGYTGAGVVVAVIDNGIQTIHPDLIANLHPTLRFNAINFTNNPNPHFLDFNPQHGTAVTALIGAQWNNRGEPVVDADGEPVLDENGAPVLTGGGTGVAPGVTIIPIKLISQVTPPLFPDSFVAAFQFAADQVDITNNSWGPELARTAINLSLEELNVLRDTAIGGRGGLGTIHVFSAGNEAGPGFAQGFEDFGQFDSASYNPWVNSRYTIGVTAVDHDGLYVNSDGTFTSYAESGASVLIAAPSGSNIAQNVGDDFGQGSGIFTADLIGDFGANAAPLPSGFDPDRDFLLDPNYTSRFTDTSASAAIVTGVIALMLEANPNLTYRDVQEILLRSARQNAQFEFPSSGGFPLGAQNTWITNQTGIFRNPDPWVDAFTTPPFLSVFFPVSDPNAGFFPRAGHYEEQPSVMTNAAGYTVSQGYGIYSEQIGYAHGVVDADLAVKMAEQWHVLNQNLDPLTERTFTTFVMNLGADLPAAERMNLDFGGLLVPGGLFGDLDGFIEYWNEYFADDDPADPTDGPFSDYDGPSEFARGTYLGEPTLFPITVPDTQAIDIEWVEVKVSLDGPAEDVNHVRMMLVSPEGTQSELNHWYGDGQHLPASMQLNTFASFFTGLTPIDVDGGNFVWTFSTNRNWGERSSDAVIIDPVTGEPLLQRDFFGTPGAALTRNWELHMENWSNSDFELDAVEIIWHGKPIAPGTQRIQGFVGIDTNSDEQFNYDRSIQTVFDSDLDPFTTRLGDVFRTLDLTQEPFADNVVVSAHRVVNGAVQADPVARFLTGADGNYYFDLVPDEYVIRISDPIDRIVLEDTDTPNLFLQHYRQEWRITPDWFFAPDRDSPDPSGEVGEIFYDPITQAPVPFLDGFGLPVAMGLKNINFLLKEDAPPDQIDVHGTVFADLNGNGIFDADDTPVGGITVYWDSDRNGAYSAGELQVISSEDPVFRGQYTLNIPADANGTFAIGIIPPTQGWVPTNPDDAVQDIFAKPGDTLANVNFFIDPPDELFPPAGADEPGNIFGVVFSDSNGNEARDPGEVGIPGFRVFIDANENGVFDDGEIFTLTSSNGSFTFSDVAPGLKQLDLEILNEGTEDASWRLTTPESGFRQVNLGPGGTAIGILFGVDNRADSDWGDLPSTFVTRAGDSPLGGPSHVITAGFQLGGRIDGEVNGLPSAGADGDDLIGGDEDGVRIIGNGGLLKVGTNTIEVTVQGVGGILNAWMDINGNGRFDAGEQVITDLHLNPGTRQVLVTLPPNVAGGPMAARFRWGQAGLSFEGPAGIGEVEDYFLPNSVVPVIVLPGDFNVDGRVDQADRDIWRSTYDSTTDLRADANKNGVVDLADLLIWRKNDGTTTGTNTLAGGSSVGGSAPLRVAPVPGPAILPYYFSDAPALQDWLQQSGMLAHLQSRGVQRIHSAFAQPGREVSTNGNGNAPFLTVSSPIASTDALTSSSTVSLLVGLNTSGVASRATFAPASRFEFDAVAGQSGVADADLLVLDQAWADLNSKADGDDELTVSWTEEENTLDDLALAAVFDEDGQWWQAL